MKFIKTQIYFLAIVILLISCSEEELPPQQQSPPSSAKSILDLDVTIFNVDGEEKQSPAKIVGRDIIVDIPLYMDTDEIQITLSASPRAVVRIAGTSVIDGKAVLDLNQSASIEVEAEDGSKIEYRLMQSNQRSQINSLFESFIDRYDIAGLSFAMSIDERLVFANGFGLANREQQRVTDINTQFRIASVSKSITSIAIMTLVEEGKLKLDDKVFGSGAILDQDYGPYRLHYRDITVRHLLSHTSGMTTNQNNDPAFNAAIGQNTAAVIHEVAKNNDLHFPPGTDYIYSNVGYMVLSQIIEKLSGLPYEQYLSSIFSPLGIRNFEITSDSKNQLKQNEAASYDEIFDPYGISLARIKGAGALIASSVDLVKLLTHVDGHEHRKDLLSSESVSEMTRHNAQTLYSLGWNSTGDAWWHIGNVQGTRAEWVRTGAKISYAVIINTTNASDYAQDFHDLSAQVQAIVNNEWPTYDLF